MAVSMFDTHAFIKRLTRAGMPIEQAEVLADEQANLVHERLATKDDIQTVRTDLAREMGGVRKDLEYVRTELKQEIDGVRKDLEHTRTELRKEIGDVRKDLERVETSLTEKICHTAKDLEQRMTIKLGSMLVIAVSTVTVINKLF